MSVTVDARGMACPMPVIKTKTAIEGNPDENIVTIVDNTAARGNVKKLAENYGYQVIIDEREDGCYLNMTKGASCEAMISKPENSETVSTTAIVVGKDKFGDGADDLGTVLIKGYFYALTEAKPLPQTIMFMNSGVNLVIEGAETLENIKKLEANGVEILACGTCLDFYGLKDQLAVGAVTNMYSVVDKMNQAAKVIRI